MVALVVLGIAPRLLAQDSIAPAGKSYSGMYQRFETDEEDRATLVELRWSRWQPRSATFEGSVGFLNAGIGGLTGGAGGVYVVNDGALTLLLRGGVALIAVPAEENGLVAAVGGYAGMALLVGTGHTNLRLELARHEYTTRQENFGGWVMGVGIAFTPRSGRRTGRCR